jgi:hypothetical protein
MQTAFNKHFEIPRRQDFARRHPNAKGFLSVRLASDGTRFRIISLRMLESTGFEILDRSCERSIVKTVELESFAPDVIGELSGRETRILCSP